jgi:hypothetical protein
VPHRQQQVGSPVSDYRVFEHAVMYDILALRETPQQWGHDTAAASPENPAEREHLDPCIYGIFEDAWQGMENPTC